MPLGDLFKPGASSADQPPGSFWGDWSKAQLVTPEEKQLFLERLSTVLNAVVPQSVQQEYQAMKQDPAAYLQSKVSQTPTSNAELINNLAAAMPITYHGTPHEWQQNKPDISKVGIGQGAQSYGHGLYFAENPEVANTYRNSVARYRITIKDSTGQAMGESKVVDEAAANQVKKLYGDKAIVERISGTTYQVNIPDEHVAKMLDWDKPLSEQAPEVKKALTKDANLKMLLETDPNMAGHKLLSFLGSQKSASDALNKLGIPGIKYLDQGSRQAGQGTRNFVIFDTNIIKDVKKK